MIGQAEKDILAAVTADPRRAEAWSILSQIAHYYRGDFERARHAAQQAYDADAYLETAADILERLALTSFETGNDADAKKWCDEGMRRFDNDWRFVHCSLLLQGWSSLPQGSAAEARAIIDRYSLNDPSGAKWNVPFLEMLMAGIHIRDGNLAEARKVMASAGERRNEIANLLWAEAANRTMLGERDSAVALLRAYAQLTPTRSANVLLSRMFTPVREHPGYRDLIRFYTPATR
jgi:tetratricopeptide (TPR) repeat protein